MTSRQILESIRQDARRHQLASQETNIFYYDTNYNNDSDLESDARDNSDSPENVDKMQRVSDNNYFTSIVNDKESNVANNTTETGKPTEHEQNALVHKVNSDFDKNYETNEYSYAGSSISTECDNCALKTTNVELFSNVDNINDKEYKSPYKTNTHVYENDNIHASGKTQDEKVLNEATEISGKEEAKKRITTTRAAAVLSPETSPSSSPSMSVLLDITPIKANPNNNININSNLNSDHTTCPARRSSSTKVTVPMLALSNVYNINYVDNLQLHAQYIKSLTSSPMAVKTSSPSAPRDHTHGIGTPKKDENFLVANSSNNNNITTQSHEEEKPCSSFSNNTNSDSKNYLNNQGKDEENNRMMVLLKLEDGRSSLLEKKQIVDSPINLNFAQRTDVNSPSYHNDHITEYNSNNKNGNLVLNSLNSLSENRSDSISRIENSLALLQVELAKEKRHSIEAEQRAYALQREVEKYKTENTSLTAALEALKCGNPILSEAISPRKPRDVSGIDGVPIDQSEWVAQCHSLNEQIHEMQKTISRQNAELASKEERIRLLEHKLADQLLSGMLTHQAYPAPSSSSSSTLNVNPTLESQRETSHFPKQIVHSVMLNKTNVSSTKLADTIPSSNNNSNSKKMIDANMTLKPSEIDMDDLNANHRNDRNDSSKTKMAQNSKEIIHRANEDNDISHRLLSSTLGDSHKLKTTKHPSDTIISQRSVKTALTNTNTNTNTSNTQTSTNVNTGRTNVSNLSNSSNPDLLTHTRTTVQRLSTSDNETDKQQENILSETHVNQDKKSNIAEKEEKSISEENASSINHLLNEMKATITKPTSTEEEFVGEVIEHRQHVEKVHKKEPASARLVLPSPHTRLYENKYNVHGIHTTDDNHNNSENNKEMKLKSKSARVKHHTTDGNVSSRRKNNRINKSAEEPPLNSNIVPSTVSARMKNKGKDSKKRTTTASNSNNSTAPIESFIAPEELQEQKKVTCTLQDMSNAHSEEHNEEPDNKEVANVNVQESIESEHIFHDTNNINSTGASVTNVLHKKPTKPPPLTEDALRHKEMPSMASLNSVPVINVSSKIHISNSTDTILGSTQGKYVINGNNDNNDMVNLEEDGINDEKNNVMQKEVHDHTESNVVIPQLAINNVKSTSNEIHVCKRKTNTPRRSIPSPLRSSVSNVMTKPSPRVSQRVSVSGGGNGACTPRKANETTLINNKSTLEQTPSSTRSSKPNVVSLTQNAMTPMAKPTNKTLFDNSHGYKPQRTGMFTLSHFAPVTHQPSSIMKKNMHSTNVNDSSSSNNNQESSTMNNDKTKVQSHKEESNKLNKQPQSARRPVSTPRLTFRQAMTPHASRLRSINNTNKHSVLIECEDGKVKDVFGISLMESKEKEMQNMGVEQSEELMSPLTMHTEQMKLPEYTPEHATDTLTESNRVNHISSNSNNNNNNILRHAKTPNEHSKRIASPRYNTSAPRYANTPTRRSTLHAETPNRYNNVNKSDDKQENNNKFGHSKMEHSLSLLHKETPASEMLSYGSALLTLSAQRRSLTSNNNNIGMVDKNKERKGDLHSGRNVNENASSARSRSNATVRRSMMNLNTSKTRPRILYTGKDHETAVMKGTTTTVTFRSPPAAAAPPAPPNTTLSSQNTTELPITVNECNADHEVNVNNMEKGDSTSTYKSSSRHTRSDKLRSSSPTHVMSSSSNTARGFNLYSTHDATATAMRIINDPEGMEDDSDEGEDNENETQNNQNVNVEMDNIVKQEAEELVIQNVLLE